MKYLNYWILLLLTVPTFSQTLSPQAQVSLLTISPGQELYSTFGHSAIRIVDPANGINVNYNYGTFNFNKPGFYLKFLRGYLDYQISSYDSFLEMDYYAQSNRLITEQGLNLSSGQKQALFDYLENNMKPENREYRYLFFTDNCSTRLRDVFLTATHDSLKFDKSFNGDTSFREWIKIYADKNHKEWADFGMNLAIGAGSDKKTGWSDAMFLPDNLMKALDKATIETPQGSEPIVLFKRDLNQVVPNMQETRFTPVLAFGLLAVLVSVFTAFQYRYQKQSVLFDKIFFTIIGLAGWILLFLWFGTDHGVTRYNQNLIWASPLVFPAVLFLNKKKWASVAMVSYGIILILGFAYFNIFGSFRFPGEILFVVLIILMRLIYMLKIKKIGFR